MDPTPALDSPLWAFSLSVYRVPGVADECLALQERLGLDVNLLLVAAYIGAVEGVALDARDMTEVAGLVTAWHDEMVRGLRGVRRALKPSTLDDANPLRAPAAALRLQVKAAELEAEKIEQAMLWQWARTKFGARDHIDARAALTANVQALLAHYSAPHDLGAPRLQVAALNFAQSKS